MTLEDKLKPLDNINRFSIIGKLLKDTIFWLKPYGVNCCDGIEIRKTKHFTYCMKYNTYTALKPFKCKYLELNSEYPELSPCTYDKNNFFH